MLLSLLAACPVESTPPTDAPLCGSVVTSSVCETPSEVEVWTIATGTVACDEYTGDTGGGTWTEWRGTLVATATVMPDGTFSAEVDPGTYALYTETDDCRGCTTVEVTSETCDPVSLPLAEVIYADAPNVYLYPETTQAVRVRLGQPQALTLVDPPYPTDGWQVLAAPDGTLRTPHGQHDYLYYEQRITPSTLQTERGWCVDGAVAQASIEDAMADLGFSPAELADFAEYWDEAFPRADTMTIYPQHERLPALRVDPAPDSVLRAWFYVAEGCAAVPLPELPAFEPLGFVVTEWGVVLDAALDRQAPLGSGDAR